MVSAARAAYRGSDTSREHLRLGRTPVRPTTRRPAVSTSRSSSSRVRRPRCSARSDTISQPSPSGRRCCPRPARNPPDIPLSSSYTPSSGAAVGRPGSHGGLQTTRSARPDAAPSAAPAPPRGPRCRCPGRTRRPRPGRAVPSSAGERPPRGRRTRSGSARRRRSGDGRVRPARAPRRPAPATGGHRSPPAAPAAGPATGHRAVVGQFDQQPVQHVNCRTPDACGRSVELS